MDPELKKLIDKRLKYWLKPIDDEYELTFKDDVAVPRKLDLLREQITVFNMMKMSNAIKCVESATIGFIFADLYN